MNLCRPLRENTQSRNHNQSPNWQSKFKHTITQQACIALVCALLLHTSCSQKQEAEAANFDVPPETTTTATAPDSVAMPENDAPNPEALPETPAVSEENDTWAYPGPKPTPGAILPQKRIIAFYGNPLSRRMGILGELPPEQMLAKLDEEVQSWATADSLTPVQPALHAIVVTAQGKPGRAGKYRLRMTNKMIDDVLAMAKKRDAIVFLDIQVGQSTLQEEIPQLAKYLKMPQVHLGIDAEFSMKNGGVPGRSIGSFDAEDINFATEFLANLAQENQLPPKLLIVHRFTQGMITNHENIKLRPEVQVVMHMDGWGHPALKKDTYRRYIQKEPVQFTGFKVFYKNDLRNSPRIMAPAEILALDPKPLYIQYQ